MIRLSWALVEGWLIGYLAAGPPRDPVKEAEVAFIMAVWRLTEAMRRIGVTAEEAGRAIQAFQRATEAEAHVPTDASQA